MRYGKVCRDRVLRYPHQACLFSLVLVISFQVFRSRGPWGYRCYIPLLHTSIPARHLSVSMHTPVHTHKNAVHSIHRHTGVCPPYSTRLSKVSTILHAHTLDTLAQSLVWASVLSMWAVKGVTRMPRVHCASKMSIRAQLFCLSARILALYDSATVQCPSRWRGACSVRTHVWR